MGQQAIQTTDRTRQALAAMRATRSIISEPYKPYRALLAYRVAPLSDVLKSGVR